MNRRNGKTLNCANCNRPFYVPKCRLERPGNAAPKYCSTSCRSTVAAVKHGFARRGQRSLTYTAYLAMRNRCYNERDPHYPDWGGRGIKVCDRWMGKDGFINFVVDLGEKPEGMTLGRIDNNGDYAPENCRWEPQQAQNRNKRSNRLIRYGGKVQCLAAWQDETGIGEATIRRRLKANWSEERALTTPPRRANAAPAEGYWAASAFGGHEPREARVQGKPSMAWFNSVVKGYSADLSGCVCSSLSA